MTSDSLPMLASAERLTDALRRAGVLDKASVRAVMVEKTRNTILSRIDFLRLDYDGATDAPTGLFLKTAHPDRRNASYGGRQEVAFYTTIAPATPAGLLARCFDADWDAESGAWHLLLENLDATHTNVGEWPLPPTLAQCRRIVAAHARFQAAWWDDPRLGSTAGSWLPTAERDAWLHDLTGKFGQFADRLDDRLPRARRELFEQFLAAAPRLFARTEHRRNLTLVHGDAHVWNCFLPRDAARDDVRIFDWDLWRIDTGSDVLAYMIAMHWYPDLRQARERVLLDHFHATLLAHGVRGYDRRALDADYRLSVLWQLATPIVQCAYGIPALIWWNNLERILLAVDDLGCRELLG